MSRQNYLLAIAMVSNTLFSWDKALRPGFSMVGKDIDHELKGPSLIL